MILSSQRTSVGAQNQQPRFRRLRRVLGQEWVIALGLMGLDVVAWIGIYGLFAYVRVDAFYATPTQFVSSAGCN